MSGRAKIGAVLRVYWRMIRIFLFYPLLIGVFFYVYIKGYHWIWGLLIILLILYFDPTFRMLWRGIRRTIKQNKKGR